MSRWIFQSIGLHMYTWKCTESTNKMFICPEGTARFLLAMWAVIFWLVSLNWYNRFSVWYSGKSLLQNFHLNKPKCSRAGPAWIIILRGKISFHLSSTCRTELPWGVRLRIYFSRVCVVTSFTLFMCFMLNTCTCLASSDSQCYWGLTALSHSPL